MSQHMYHTQNEREWEGRETRNFHRLYLKLSSTQEQLFLNNLIEGLPRQAHIIDAELALRPRQIVDTFCGHAHDLHRHSRCHGDFQVKFHHCNALLLWDWVLEHTPAATSRAGQKQCIVSAK